MGQSSAGASGGGTHVMAPTRGSFQQSRGHMGRPATTHAKLHVMTQQEGRTSPDVIIGTLLIFGRPAFILIVPGATHSFISSRF